MQKYKNILSLSSKEAKNYFLQAEHYCTLNLPPYFQFQNLLNALDVFLKDKERKDYFENGKKVRDIEQVNAMVYHSKDGKYQWRPLQVIHPVLYLELLNVICEPSNWEKIKKRFAEFQQNTNIICGSIPVKHPTGKSNTASAILHWWEQMEQAVIAESLSYSYIFTTDITDFYSSIYTHTIPWALHGKEVAKENKRDTTLLGNTIDFFMQEMHNAQTNGIPQGSVLMDFIAEIVLGYADLLLSEQLQNEDITDYKIFRYRDDYKILVNNPKNGELILKLLTEILLSLNLKLNTSKTKKDEDIIGTIIKKDKLEWINHSSFMDLLNPSYQSRMNNKKYQFINQQKTLLGIYQFSRQYPNSGTVARLLSIYSKKIHLTAKDDIPVLIGILTSIMITNPRSYPQESALLSRFLMKLAPEKRITFVTNIKRKLNENPHTDLLDIWLQRISWKIDPYMSYDPQICKVVTNPNESLWDNSWLNDSIKHIFFKFPIVNRISLENMPLYIEEKEVNPFSQYPY